MLIFVTVLLISVTVLLLDGINGFHQLLDGLVSIYSMCDVGGAVAQYQLHDFQRDSGVVHEAGAGVASIMGQVGAVECLEGVGALPCVLAEAVIGGHGLPVARIRDEVRLAWVV